MNLGFIGLGTMGLPMSRHLVAAGHDVMVASRSAPPIAAAVQFGATAADSLEELARSSDIVMMCVPNSPDVREIIDTVAPALKAGSMVINHSTIDPDVERSCHQTVALAGSRYLDAPLSGGSIGAETGQLIVMVGGDPDVLEEARPTLEAYSELIVYVGRPGMGQVVKLCNNMILAAQMLATAEATSFALESGADPHKLYEVLTHSTGDCTAVRTRLPVAGVVASSPASNGWKPGFATDLMAKDLGLAIGYGHTIGVTLESAQRVRTVLLEASAAGFGREDFSALSKIVFSRAQRNGPVQGGPGE